MAREPFRARLPEPEDFRRKPIDEAELTPILEALERARLALNEGRKRQHIIPEVRISEPQWLKVATAAKFDLTSEDFTWAHLTQAFTYRMVGRLGTPRDRRWDASEVASLILAVDRACTVVAPKTESAA